MFEHLDLACMQAFARVAGGRCGFIPRKFWKSDRLQSIIRLKACKIPVVLATFSENPSMFTFCWLFLGSIGTTRTQIGSRQICQGERDSGTAVSHGILTTEVWKLIILSAEHRSTIYECRDGQTPLTVQVWMLGECVIC